MEEVKRHGDFHTWKAWRIWLRHCQNLILCLRAHQIQIMSGFEIHLTERTNLPLTQGRFQKFLWKLDTRKFSLLKSKKGWADESIDYLNEKIAAEGPFYGLLGYSQGSAFIPVFLSNTGYRFSRLMMYNGYLPTTHEGLECQNEFNLLSLGVKQFDFQTFSLFFCTQLNQRSMSMKI